MEAAALAVCISSREYSPESTPIWLHPPTPSATPNRSCMVLAGLAIATIAHVHMTDACRLSATLTRDLQTLIDLQTLVEICSRSSRVAVAVKAQLPRNLPSSVMKYASSPPLSIFSGCGIMDAPICSFRLLSSSRCSLQKCDCYETPASEGTLHSNLANCILTLRCFHFQMVCSLVLSQESLSQSC